jgi:hypothetical protein
MKAKFAGLTLAMVLLGGCINISTQLQPINESVKADKTGSDCTWIFLGLGFGSLSVERAMMQETIVSADRADRPEMIRRIRTPYITKIHSIALQDWTALIVGERCIVVTGE